MARENKPGQRLTGTETILVVEDEELARGLVVEILTKQGYNILDAPDAEAALNLSEEFDGDIELLLTDVIMPRMNGKELYRKMCISHPTIKVLYMSGYTDNLITPYGILEAGTHFLQKPFTVKGLAQKVRDVLDS
ncbi:MAG: response regulator [Candidatus Marinimicrobia bacterium]|nr:response regulator [Candidatus Neomarinimicrobiota bacterium]MCF7839870.1 response regulator [Candidatus Neomarinimicrobiota bacterium]MCF7902260.1 response regulator [Candidatus Neomarinimicrobiota bacterium]